jgi:hypothetical protein
MSTTSTPDAGTTAPVAGSNGDQPVVPSLGEWVDLPPAEKKNGPNSKFAPELNATAREQADHVREDGTPQARPISIQKSVRSASGRASTIKRKLKEGKVNGLEFPAERFEIVPRGSVVYAIYHAPETAKADEPKADTPKADAPKPSAREAQPDPKAKGKTTTPRK